MQHQPLPYGSQQAYFNESHPARFASLVRRSSAKRRRRHPLKPQRATLRQLN